MNRAILTIFLILASFAGVKAQQSSTGTAHIGASIVQPTTITQTSEMNFGDITVSTTSGGKIVMDPKGKTQNKGGASTENGAPASFTINVPADFTYSISLPKSSVSETDSTSKVLNISEFTSYPSVDETSTGTKTFSVGATLTVDKADAIGEYEADIPFEVSVNYN